MSRDVEEPGGPPASGGHSSTSIPIAQERVRVEKVPRLRGSLRVHVAARVREERLSIPLATEHTELRRVRVDRFVETVPPVRQEGDVIIVPLVEEVVVVQKKLRVREEIHLVRHTEVRHEEHRVELRSEHASISRQAPAPFRRTPP